METPKNDTPPAAGGPGSEATPPEGGPPQNIGPGYPTRVDESAGAGAADPTAKPDPPMGKNLYEVRLPTPGRIVAYIINEEEARPAIVVSTDGGTRVSLRVFTDPRDGSNRTLPNFDQRNGSVWAPNVEMGTSPGTWHWPERV